MDDSKKVVFKAFLQQQPKSRIRNYYADDANDPFALIDLLEGQRQFGVSGAGCTVAIIDSGINRKHEDFAQKNKIVYAQNFTQEGGVSDVTDHFGHGTHMAGIISANGRHSGVAPDARLVILKVMDKSGEFYWENYKAALRWILQNHSNYGILAICAALDNPDVQYKNDFSLRSSELVSLLKSLASKNIILCAPAGNGYAKSPPPRQTMSFPGILRECMSVGAVYAGNDGERKLSNTETFQIISDQIAPFSQRMHDEFDAPTFTKIFAPGAFHTSSGIGGPSEECKGAGTSQATATVCGVILLLQEYYARHNGDRLPDPFQLYDWMFQGGVSIHDIANPQPPIDSVVRTGKSFQRISVLGALKKTHASIFIS